MSIFYLGGKNEKVPPEAIMPEMFEDRYFLPGVIHGGEDYLIRVYMNDAHLEDETSADNHQFEVDYITKDLITEARTIDPSLDWEFYQHLSSAESFGCCNDESGDFVSLIEAWPQSIYMTHSELVKWAEGKYTPPERKSRLVKLRKRRLGSGSDDYYGILCADGTVKDLSGNPYNMDFFWIVQLDTPFLYREVLQLRNFIDDVCIRRCDKGLDGCKIATWDCPKLNKYLTRKEYRVIYEEIILHEFPVDALDLEDAQEEFGQLAHEGAFDWSDGDVVSGQIVRVISPDDEVAFVNSTAADYEALASNPGKIELPLGDGYSIVAEKNDDSDYKEMFIYLRCDSDDSISQDLAIVGENYTYGEEGSVEPRHGQYSIKVYADLDNEDWTTEFNIGRYVEEEGQA